MIEREAGEKGRKAKRISVTTTGFLRFSKRRNSEGFDFLFR